ncbi:MAG: hypothetical protein JWR38_5036 [Mucilaginibacter sp.]|nr:hypothetical protein [Mucilaginibacter sp.]
MKRKVFILLVSAMATLTLNTFAQDGNWQTRSVSGFNSIESGGPFNVHIKVNGTESLKLNIDVDVINDVKTEVVDGVLKIGFKNRMSFHRNIRKADIFITAKSLEGLGNSGSGNLDVEGAVTGQNAKVSLTGSGNIKTAVKSGSLDAKISGSGSIDIKGSTDDANLRITGSGEINGRDLKTESVTATISGSGGISIIANKSVSARITGSGSVAYSGNAVVAETKYSGSGRVRKVD